VVYGVTPLDTVIPKGLADELFNTPVTDLKKYVIG
jgi:hypothetical protein